MTASATHARGDLLNRGLLLERQTGKALGSRALIADAQQTYACWYLSSVALAGLALNALFGLWWADPVAGLGIVVFLLREGWEAWNGEDDND